ncbi:hypothetical protein XENTR_v10004741 [Xenopus tropicalis]|nr:hypothetical protein XENTR_v10004741 [Xenopus tropicalis]
MMSLQGTKSYCYYACLDQKCPYKPNGEGKLLLFAPVFSPAKNPNTVRSHFPTLLGFCFSKGWLFLKVVVPRNGLGFPSGSLMSGCTYGQLYPSFKRTKTCE